MADTCAECGSSFGSPADLLTHRRKSHPSRPGSLTGPVGSATAASLECGLCGARFLSREQLARHNLSPHYRSGRPQPRPPAYSNA